MASTISGPTEAPKVAQVHENQSAPKIGKRNSNGGANPQDTVTISSQAHAASQAEQNSPHANQYGGKK